MGLAVGGGDGDGGGGGEAFCCSGGGGGGGGAIPLSTAATGCKFTSGASGIAAATYSHWRLENSCVRAALGGGVRGAVKDGLTIAELAAPRSTPQAALLAIDAAAGAGFSKFAPAGPASAVH